MEKRTWLVHAVAQCETCGKEFDGYKNAQALAALHALKNGHKVTGEVGLAFSYDAAKKS